MITSRKTEPTLIEIAKRLDEFTNEFECVRQDVEMVATTLQDAPKGTEMLTEEFVGYRSYLGRLATELGYDLVQVMSFGKLNVFHQHLTYRLYNRETGELQVHSLSCLEEVQSDLEILQMKKERADGQANDRRGIRTPHDKA
jgi:hypothetical protein